MYNISIKCATLKFLPILICFIVALQIFYVPITFFYLLSLSCRKEAAMDARTHLFMNIHAYLDSHAFCSSHMDISRCL